MNFDQAVAHILRVCEAGKTVVHWQVAARICLASLYLDARISAAVREEISGFIRYGTLYQFDYLLTPPPAPAQEIPPRGKKFSE